MVLGGDKTGRSWAFIRKGETFLEEGFINAVERALVYTVHSHVVLQVLQIDNIGIIVSFFHGLFI